MAEIEQRHEVRVRVNDGTFVFVAEPEEGRLVIREEGAEGEVCALTLDDPEELAGFIEGLRRIFRATGLAKSTEGTPKEARRRLPGPGAVDEQGALGEPDREELIAAARRRNPNAFHAWSPDEEETVRARFERGDAIADIARDHQRSPRAIEMRLRKLSVLDA